MNVQSNIQSARSYRGENNGNNVANEKKTSNQIQQAMMLTAPSQAQTQRIYYRENNDMMASMSSEAKSTKKPASKVLGPKLTNTAPLDQHIQLQ